MTTCDPIGTIHSDFAEPGDPDEMRKHESTIIVDGAYEDGLHRIEQNDHLVIIFHIHEAGDYTLKGPRLYGEDRGTFACRSPHRPNPIGVTTVELLERDGRELRVSGLDAIEQTPVLDIKPHASALDCPSRAAEDDRRENPRERIERSVRDRDLESLLLGAGELHGHFCPFLSLGVMAGVFAQRELGLASDGMEDVVAVVETNNCFADGVQYVTGCTLGNNALVYRDYGKTAVTLAERGTPGVRIRVTDRERVLERYPEAADLFRKVLANRDATDAERRQFDEAWPRVSFDLIGRPLKEFCDVETGVDLDLPEYAPVHEDRQCADCGEQVMASKAVDQDGEPYCVPCAGAEYLQLDGRGLHTVE
jgi:formylmethanofuran dehydrogenase subunit E